MVVFLFYQYRVIPAFNLSWTETWLSSASVMDSVKKDLSLLLILVLWDTVLSHLTRVCQPGPRQSASKGFWAKHGREVRWHPHWCLLLVIASCHGFFPTNVCSEYWKASSSKHKVSFFIQGEIQCLCDGRAFTRAWDWQKLNYTKLANTCFPQIPNNKRRTGVIITLLWGRENNQIKSLGCFVNPQCLLDIGQFCRSLIYTFTRMR